MYVTWKIQRTPALPDGGWDEDATETITSFHDPIVRVNTGDARDSFSFKVTNTSNDFDNYFQAQDRITISRVLNSTSLASSDVLMVGSIQQTPIQEASNMNLIRVEGYNFSEAVLSGITFVDVTNRTIPQALSDALAQVTLYNENFTVTWNGGNPTTKTDGTAFPTINEKWFNKPLRQLMEKWSVKENTGDVNYYWYVDLNNTLVWRASTQDISDTFDADSDNHRKLTIKKDVNDVKNWVIAKGGLDPKRKPIQDRYWDISSIGKHGMRYHIITNIYKEGGTVEQQDVVDYNSQNGTTHATMAEAESAWASFTPYWSKGITYNSFNSYVNAYRVYVKQLCREAAEAFVKKHKYGTLQVELEFAPGKGWVLGQLIQCTIPQLTKEGVNVPTKALRVVDIQYTTTADTYTLEEDDGTI